MIIDFHTHVFPPFFRDDRNALFPREAAFKSLYSSPQSSLAGVSDLINNMDEAEVDRSVIFGFPWEDEALFQRHNDYIIESVHRYPDRLTGFCCFSILSPGGAGEAERCLDSGLSGVGELAVYGSGLTSEITDAFKDVMSLCSQYDVPMLLHVNEPVGHNYPGKAPITLHQIYRFAKSYPSNRIVLAHWGGGLFFFALLKKEVKEVLNNVWFDTAASPYLYTPDIYRIAGDIIGFEKILFGSDYPLLKPQRYFKEMALAGLFPRHVDQIAGLNAAKLLNSQD
ncbi:MAG: amidohydrolase family protein [Deltaproteobacteria bacterium]|nr:amidohydrolase family protein [Deltaproteobacteria bacterium]